MGEALAYISDAGLDAIARHEHELLDHALERLQEVPGITLYGPPAERRPASSRSTSTASIRTMSRRCSTGRESPCGPATTAPSP